MIPRELRPGQRPFDAVRLAKDLENIVAKKIGNTIARKYTHFSVVRFYQRSVTAFTVGCNLRCFFCWSHRARDYPELYGKHYKPTEVVEKLLTLAKQCGTNKVRVSGGEPTIVKEHLLEILKLVEEEPKISLFILETNGILLGADESFAKDLARASSKVIVRVSIKAGRPDEFYRRTGALPEQYILPFKAIENLLSYGVRVYPAVIVDPRLVSIDERRLIMNRLSAIDPKLIREIEEETIEMFPEAIRRMKIYGFELKAKT